MHVICIKYMSRRVVMDSNMYIEKKLLLLVSFVERKL